MERTRRRGSDPWACAPGKREASEAHWTRAQSGRVVPEGSRENSDLFAASTYWLGESSAPADAGNSIEDGTDTSGPGGEQSEVRSVGPTD